MRRLFNIYILVLLALGVACQRVDLPENQPAELPTGAIGSKATITFSTADVAGPETRGILNAKVEVETLHLIVFDENGMLVEVCEATELDKSDHVDPETGEIHKDGRHYTVTLTLTDEPRIIHYVANCPVEQVVYGHETSIIGNMYVDRNNTVGATTEYEVSYWARIEVPHILVTEKEEGDKVVVSLVDDIKNKFMHVPLLRNYAEITVTQADTKKFEVLGFTVYNLINRGTVAPYNSNTQKFQSFFERDGETITKYLYPQMYKEFHYEGHALTSATLITDLVTIKDENGVEKVKEFQLNEPFYVYERKVSVMTDEEEKWRESPPHIIIKARYNGGDDVDEDSPIYYYKMDLVYTDKDADEIKYYNILRNFQYNFNITEIHDEGYSSWKEAAAGAAGNNISGSSSTSKLTNVSDDEGRLWVSYTDITLVTGDAVVFRYMYIPNYYGTEGNEYTKDAVHNELVRFENVYDTLGKPVGDVITRIEVAEEDASDDWREVTIYVNEPTDIIRQQILSLRTNNPNLNRQIRHTLRKKLKMEVECTPKVLGNIKEKVEVKIKLPEGMTEDMFPLALNMETFDRTLSPDATQNTIPVTTGKSIIEGRRDQLSYYYTVTIPTFEQYQKDKVVTTHWLTNKAANASTFYVDNKYFNQASDSWENYKYTFSNASCSSSAVGVGQDVTISFKMNGSAINKKVTIALEGMTFTGLLDGVNYTDATVVTYTPSKENVSIQGFKTTTATGAVSFTLDAEEYNIFGPVEGSRETYQFGGAFAATSLKAEADTEVDFTFNIDPDALAALKALYPEAGDAGVPMYVTLDRLHPADDQLIYSQAKAGGDRYIYRIKSAGTQTIRLATTEDVGGTCTVTLQADYFDTDSVTIQQSNVFATAEFREWSGTNTDYVIVGQTVQYYVNVSSSSVPTSVTIDGEKATRYTVNNTPEGTTVWYIDWSGSTKENHAMNVEMVVEGVTFTKKVGEIKVADWSVSTTATTSPKTDGTMYVMQNTSYNKTYCTSEGNNLSASKSLNYYSLFTFETSGKIKSVAKGTYCTGTSNGGSISFDANGTAYTFNNGKISYTSRNNTYYLRQSNETTISLSTTNSKNSWQFYTVTIVMP